MTYSGGKFRMKAVRLPAGDRTVGAVREHLGVLGIKIEDRGGGDSFDRLLTSVV